MTRALVLLALLLGAGCSVGGGDDDASRVDRCVDRLLSRARPDTVIAERRAVTERYLRETYCERFEDGGWVHDDGTLSIGAQHWLMGAGTSECEAAEPGGEARAVACPPDPTLDCALLHHVRRDEVRAYLVRLQQKRPVVCDDGTPLDELGVG